MADLQANFFEGDGDAVPDGARPRAEPERVVDEGAESDLFAELGGDESDDGEAELFADDTDDGEAEEGDKGAKAQLQRLRRQRTDLRSANQRLQEQVASISAQLDASREMASVITERYAKYDNPAAMVGFDADFMEAMESMKDQVPEISKVAKIVRKKMEGKSLFTTADNQPAAKPAEDPRVAKLLEAHARDRVTAVLRDLKIKPTLQRTVAKEVLARIEKKEDITRTDVLRSLQGAMESEGWTESDIRSVASKKKAAPDVGSPRQAVTPGSSDSGSGDERKKAESKGEWDSNREGLFRSFEQSLQ